jgi:hypothetical protein
MRTGKELADCFKKGGTIVYPNLPKRQKNVFMTVRLIHPKITLQRAKPMKRIVLTSKVFHQKEIKEISEYDNVIS